MVILACSYSTDLLETLAYSMLWPNMYPNLISSPRSCLNLYLVRIGLWILNFMLVAVHLKSNHFFMFPTTYSCLSCVVKILSLLKSANPFVIGLRRSIHKKSNHLDASLPMIALTGSQNLEAKGTRII
jgi:hypothetical protein